MSHELKIYSGNKLVGVNKKEINEMVNEIVLDSKNNMNKLCNLTLECTTLLASAESKNKALTGQKGLKKLINNITGKNNKLREAMIIDSNNALYATQNMINCIMKECNNNSKLFYAINNKVNDLFLELGNTQDELSEEIIKNRRVLVAFYDEYKERICEIEDFNKERCPECRGLLEEWEVLCPKCGTIHPLKIKDYDDETIEKINSISNILTKDFCSKVIIWDDSIKKIDGVLRKIESLSEITNVKYSKDLIQDINSLHDKCKSAEFQIAIVGVMKAGKSFLLNALIGHEIASVQVNPETAALTKFRSANCFYVNVKFHTKSEWNKLKKSVFESKTKKEYGFAKELKNEKLIKAGEAKYIGKQNKYIECKDLTELKNLVKKYTSSEFGTHIFVSEVEVGVDESLFKMPKEVVFVDTPGLEDPVKYRSDITKKYIKNAHAVLVAVPTRPLTVEGDKVITTVLDYASSKKTFIVATQTDSVGSKEDCDKIIHLWKKMLVESKRYSNVRAVRVSATSAKMYLLLTKWISLPEEERLNPDSLLFTNDDYNDLEGYVKKIKNVRSYRMEELVGDDITQDLIISTSGIVQLRKLLEKNLINEYRKILSKDIIERFNTIKIRIIKINEEIIYEEIKKKSLADKEQDDIQKEIDSLKSKKNKLIKENNKIKKDTNKLLNSINEIVDSLG